MSELIYEPLNKEGIVTAEAESKFWEIFNLSDIHVNEQEVDREKLRLKLISYGFEAGEAHETIEQFLRVGAIARLNTTTYIKTSLYDKLQKACKERDELKNQLNNKQLENKKSMIYRVPKELCNKSYAGILLSRDGAYFEIDNGGNVVRFLSNETYQKEFKIGS